MGAPVGFARLSFDEAALSKGEIVIQRVLAILPDGTVLDAPGLTPLPPRRTLPRSTDGRPVAVYLGVPELRLQQSNVHMPGDTVPRRWVREEVRAQDLCGDADERTVDIGHPHALLRVEGEPLDGISALKLAEVEPTSGGAFRLSDRYIPRCTRICATPLLRGRVEAVIGRLSVRRRSLAATPFDPRPGTPMTLSAFALAMQRIAVDGALPALAHVLDQDLAPERAWQVLSWCAGQLCGLHPTISPQDLPRFNADDLHGCIAAMELVIEQLLQHERPKDFDSVPFQRTAPQEWTARFPAEIDVGRREVFLLLRGPDLDARVAAVLSSRLKMESPSNLAISVQNGLRGLDLQPVAQPPPGVPTAGVVATLRLRRTGISWDRIREARAVALYIAGELGALTPELVVQPLDGP